MDHSVTVATITQLVQKLKAIPHPTQPLHSVPTHQIPAAFHVSHAWPTPPHTYTLTPATRTKINVALAQSLAPATLKSYESTIKHFLAFCNMENIPTNLCFPANKYILCGYAALQVGVILGNTLHNHMAALKTWHGFYNLQWNGGHRLQYVLAEVHNANLPSSCCPQHLPITTTMIELLMQSLDSAVLEDTFILACILTAFWDQPQLGEIVPNSNSTLMSTCLPLWTHLKCNINCDSITIHLPCTKTVHKDQDAVLVRQCSAIDLLLPLQKHLKASSLLSSTPLFTYIVQDNSQHILTKKHFLCRCNKVWAAAGYPQLTGYSFHIGSTTELLVAGVALDMIKAIGYWSSNAFLWYWHSLEDIAPLCMANAGHYAQSRLHST